MKKFSHFFTLLLNCLLFSLTNADLQGLTLAAFNSELATWTADTGATMSGTSGLFLLFSLYTGFSQIQKTYTGIDDHQYIAFSLSLYSEGGCNGNILQISFDDVQTEVLRANSLWMNATSFYIKGGLPHSRRSLQVTIAMKMPSNCPSFRFGIRELNMNFMKKLESTEQQFCHTLLTYPNLNPVCECGQAQVEELPCVSCSTGCLSCGESILGIETCSKCNSTKLLEWDGEACSTCGSHCSECAGKMGDDCRNCLDEHFIYGNETCIQGCASPFKQLSTGGLIGSCAVPCADDEWLYADLSCKNSCPSYFVEETDENGIRWCKTPCEDDDYYSEEKGTCEGVCEYPNTVKDIGGIKTCSLNLDEGQTEQIKGMSKGVNGANTGSSGAILALSFLSSSDSSSIFMGAFSKMLQYIKYMDIVYPAKVQLMLEMLNSNSSTGGFASKMMKKELEKFPERGLPEKFEYFGARSSFFVNYWPSLFILLILLSVTILLILLTSYSKSFVKMHQVLTQITGQLKWNMILLLLCGDLGDIVFFTALEVTTADPETLESSLSLLVCIIINLIALWVMVKILTVNFSLRKLKKRKEQDIEIKWGNYKTLFAIYKDKSYFQQIFMFIFIARVSIFNAVIGYLFNFPFVQAILITLANLCMLLYLIFKRPMKAWINFIQQVVLEGFLLIFNVCICILAGLDHNKVEAYDFRDKVGEMMVVINIIVPIVSVVILGAKFLILGIVAYKEWKAEKLAKKKSLGKEIRVELPRKQRPGDQTVVGLEAIMANKSNIFEMSSSNVSFLNNSQPWINVEPNEPNPKLSQIVGDFGIYDHQTSSSPEIRPYQASPILSQGMGLSDMQGSPARKIFKKPRIKRNGLKKRNENGVKNEDLDKNS